MVVRSRLPPPEVIGPRRARGAASVIVGEVGHSCDVMEKSAGLAQCPPGGIVGHGHRSAGDMTMGERLGWIVTYIDDVLEIGLLAGTFLTLLLAAAIVHHQRRPRWSRL